MNVRHLKRIAAGALALAVTSAWGGQITLYERPDFNGPSFVANDRIDTVARQGSFNDTASSIVVNDGRWEVCTQAYFRGRCTELLPGSYPSMSVSLNGRVGSARQIGYADPVSSGRVYLYEDPSFGGAWVTIDRGVADDLDWAKFSNPTHRATSVRVESGNWLLCTDMAFRGDCRVLGPGEYPLLAGGIRSARQVWSPEYGSLDVYRRW